MYNRPEPTNPVSSDYGLSNRWLTRVCVCVCVCVRVFHKARNTWNMFMEHSFRAYLYIDTWSWSSSVARSVILIPFKLTARETRCSFLPLAFAYWREKKNIVKSFLVKMREGNDWSVFNFWNFNSSIKRYVRYVSKFKIVNKLMDQYFTRLTWILNVNFIILFCNVEKIINAEIKKLQ